jgi:hypothetical protein
MMDPRIRASDAQREEIVERMREQVGTGRLTLEEFSERAACAYRARTVGELAELTRDLPAPPRTPAATALHPPIPAVVLIAAALAIAFLVATGLNAADSMNSMMDHMGSMMHH